MWASPATCLPVLVDMKSGPTQQGWVQLTFTSAQAEQKHNVSNRSSLIAVCDARLTKSNEPIKHGRLLGENRERM